MTAPIAPAGRQNQYQLISQSLANDFKLVSRRVINNLVYLTGSRSQFAAIHTSVGDGAMDAELFRLSCEGLGEPLSDTESSQLVAQLAGPSGGVDFQAFVVFILRRRQSSGALMRDFIATRHPERTQIVHSSRFHRHPTPRTNPNCSFF